MIRARGNALLKRARAAARGREDGVVLLEGARLVADAIRGRHVNEALELLELMPQRGASFFKKVLLSAIANASQDEGVDVNDLYVGDVRADDGPMLNNRLRYRPGPQGRAMPYAKKTSHLTVIVVPYGTTEIALNDAAEEGANA